MADTMTLSDLIRQMNQTSNASENAATQASLAGQQRMTELSAQEQMLQAEKEKKKEGGGASALGMIQNIGSKEGGG